MKRLLAATLALGVLTAPASAQFVGPSVQGQATTVAEAQNVRAGNYVVVTGNIVAHQRSDYFTFRDDTGEIRVEISSRVWQGREVTPETTVRLLAEVDQGRAGRYLWVKSLEVVP
jgi:uncharacterized protein (TIGR00156 family)